MMLWKYRTRNSSLVILKISSYLCYLTTELMSGNWSTANPAIPMNNTSIFNLPAFEIYATDYVDLINTENVTAPPVNERLSDDLISETIVNPD